MKNLLICLFLIALLLTSVHAQTTAPTPNVQQQAENQRQLEAQRREQQRQQIQVRREQNQRFENLKIISENQNVKLKPISEIRNTAPLPNAKLTREQKILLAPGSSDLNAYAAFLKQPKTGLIKLFSDLGCEENAAILRVEALCAQWIPNSGFYSFRRGRYAPESLADIRYKDGFFISDGLLAQGVMTILGDVPLENVSLADSRMSFLTTYKPDPQNRAAAVQVKNLADGIEASGYTYRSILPARENTTYALRSIAYRGSYPVSFQGYEYNLLGGDKRKDIIVVFRVIRKNSDGSLTLLWKELDRRDSPKLVYPKKSKNNKPTNYQG